MHKKQINPLLSIDNDCFEVVQPHGKTEDILLNDNVEPKTRRFVPAHSDQERTVELLKKQDPYIIAQLYDAYGSVLYGYVLRIVRCTELAEQVMQDTFLKVWLHGTRYDESKGRLFTWLLNIARNTAIDATRNSHFHNSKKTEHIDSLINLRGGECLNPDTVGLQEVVKKMEEKYKVLIDLIYFNQYTQQEAAEAMGIPLGTVKSRVRYAILELKKAFDI